MAFLLWVRIALDLGELFSAFAAPALVTFWSYNQGKEGFFFRFVQTM